MYKVYLAITLVFFSAGVAMAEEPFLIYAAKRTYQTPVIDGALNDACWKKTERTSAFVAIGGKEVSIQTQGMLCHDKSNLYISFICEEPLIDTLKERITKGLIPPFEESVEIFIDSNHDGYTYLQFRVGILGERDSRRGLEVDLELNKKWSAAVFLNKGSWSVEAAIPFDYLGAMSSSKSLWGLNLNRQRIVGTEGKWTCWSDTKGGFHSPAHFGHLVFADYPIWLETYFGDQINDIEREIKSLLQRYPKLTVGVRDGCVLSSKTYQDLLEQISAANLNTGDKCAPFYDKGESLAALYEGALLELRLAVIQGEFSRKR